MKNKKLRVDKLKLLQPLVRLGGEEVPIDIGELKRKYNDDYNTSLLAASIARILAPTDP